MPSFVALLRGINVGGNRKVPMADLRALCGPAGFKGVKTYIQSGNLIFTAPGSASSAAAKLEAAIVKNFGFAVDVLVLTKEAWDSHAAGNPFPQESAAAPSRVMLLLSKAKPKPDAITGLRHKASVEQIIAVGDALWIYYPEGQATTKLTRTLLDRAVGSPVTARNWRTVQEIQKLLG